MPDEHTPTRDRPWVRVRDVDGHEFDRHYLDAGIGEDYDLVEGYPPNLTAQPRPHKYRTSLDGSPADQAKGAELAQRLEEAGLTEETADMTADEKRVALARHEATALVQNFDDAQEG